jgi:hypothetical protein
MVRAAGYCPRRRAAPPHVRQLRHAASTVAVDAFSERTKRRLVALVPKCDRAIRRCRRGLDRRRTERHDESAATSRLAHVVVHLARIDQTVTTPTRRVRRRHDPVAQYLPAQLERRVEVREDRRTSGLSLGPFAVHSGHLRRSPLRHASSLPVATASPYWQAGDNPRRRTPRRLRPRTRGPASPCSQPSRSSLPRARLTSAESHGRGQSGQRCCSPRMQE